MLHRQPQYCPACGKQLESLNKKMPSDFVGDTFIGYKPCDCKLRASGVKPESPKCSKDPNTCQVHFCGWPHRCNEVEPESKGEEGRYFYTNTEFPGMKVRMDGIREFLVDGGYRGEELNDILQGAGYWACCRIIKHTEALQKEVDILKSHQEFCDCQLSEKCKAGLEKTSDRQPCSKAVQVLAESTKASLQQPTYSQSDFTLWVVVNKWEYDHADHKWFNNYITELKGLRLNYDQLLDKFLNK